MKKKIFLIVLLISLGAAFCFNTSTNPNNQEKILSHKVNFYDEKTFLEGTQKSKGIINPEFKIKGGIVPHHLYAGLLIADFFKRLSFQNPSIIILIGPNHYEKGSAKALGSLYNWETPFGVVEADRDLIKKLIDKNLIEIDETVLPEDHSVSGMMPFIKFLLPETRVVPILLKRGFSEKESEILATYLSGIVNEKVVLVAPVDFSHYLNNPKARKNDEITLKVMKDFDFRKLYSLDNNYLDSPSSIGVLLKVMQKINSVKMDILFNTNSGEMQKNNSIETTSYFSIMYR